MSSRTTYPGKALDVVYDATLCIHAAECGRSAGPMFEGGRDPWCKPDEVSVDEATEIVARCPTGALTYQRKDGGPTEAAPAANVVVVSPNGPLYLRGELAIARRQFASRRGNIHAAAVHLIRDGPVVRNGSRPCPAGVSRPEMWVEQELSVAAADNTRMS